MIHDRIAEIASDLVAFSFCVTSAEMDREDIQQKMVLSLLEASEKDPEFPNQKKAYLLQRAKWEAYHLLGRERFADHLVGFEIDAGEEGEDGGWASEYDTVLTDAGESDPANLAELNEKAMALLESVEGLSLESKKLVRFIYLGYSESEIADILHVSRPAITQRKKAIAKVALARYEGRK